MDFWMHRQRSIAAKCSLHPDRIRSFAADSVRISIMCIRAGGKTGRRTIAMTEKNEIILFTDNDVLLEVPITPERETH